MMSKYSSPAPLLYRKSDRQAAMAIICLVIALLCLSVGVFITNPESIVAIIFLVLGILFGLAMIIFFVRYAYYAKQEQKNGS
jgi:predicted MFS family arabinose efflux permease